MKRKSAKEILEESFREIARNKPIDKITVSDIIDNCGYSSATFYRQFKDKYDLIAWSYTKDLEKILNGLRYDEVSWKQVLTDLAVYYNKHREYLANLMKNTRGYDSFVYNMTEIHISCLKHKIKNTEKSSELDERTEMFVRLYVHGTVQLTCEWILGKYSAGVEELVSVYDQSFPPPLREILLKK